MKKNQYISMHASLNPVTLFITLREAVQIVIRFMLETAVSPAPLKWARNFVSICHSEMHIAHP